MAELNTDVETVERAKAGDAAAWDELFQRYQLPLFAFLYELISDRQGSLDIVQEAFISAVRHLNSLRDPEKFGSWLFGIAHQKAVQRWRRSTRESTGLEQYAAEPVRDQGAPDELLIRKEDSEVFFAALQHLPPPQRAALLLHFLEGFSIEEIAGITNSQLGTVKSRLFYGKQALRKRLEMNR